MNQKTELTERPLWEKVVLEKMTEWKIDSKLHEPLLDGIENILPLIVVFSLSLLFMLTNKSQK